MNRPDLQEFLPTIVLENFCLESGIALPDFQHLGSEGLVHAPIFVFKVIVLDVEITATGHSKKKAKHAAAHGALLKLLEKAKKYFKSYPNMTFEKYKESEEYKKNCEPKSNIYKLQAAYLYLLKLQDSIINYEIPDSFDNNQFNAVGQLQEVCMKNKWMPPKYTDAKGKLFSIFCEIEIKEEFIIEKGEGKSKKLAKRLSAMQVLKVLEARGLFSFVKETESSNKRSRKINENANEDYIPAKIKLDQFYSSIDEELNSELTNFYDNFSFTHNYDFCEKLDEVAVYIECEVKYIDLLPIDEEILTYSTMVNLIPYDNCPPVVTGWGLSTISAKESRNQAAKTALMLFNETRFADN